MLAPSVLVLLGCVHGPASIELLDFEGSFTHVAAGSELFKLELDFFTGWGWLIDKIGVGNKIRAGRFSRRGRSIRLAFFEHCNLNLEYVWPPQKQPGQ